MKTIARTILIVAALTLALPQPSRAQMSAGNEPQRPSADAWEFMKYGEIHPSLYTGTLSLSIPFYTYKDPDFELPISFDYATTGHIPNVVSGILGPDWTLNLGGVITREVRGLPDDKSHNIDTGGGTIYAEGYLSIHKSAMDISQATLYTANDGRIGDELCYWLFPSGGASSPAAYDAEPDLYHFNFMGYSGSFILGPAGDVTVYGTSVSPSLFRIEMDSNFSNHTPISITVADGYRYEFDGYAGEAGDTDQEDYDGYRMISAWKLSRIVAPNGRKMEFGYGRTAGIHVQRPYSVCYSVSVFGPSGWGEGDFSVVNGRGRGLTDARGYYSFPETVLVDGDTLAVLSYQEPYQEKYYNANMGPDNEVSPRRFLGVDKLSGISIRRGGKDIRTCDFSYNTEAKSGTGFLSSVTISGEGTYSMEYYRNDLCPMYGTFKIDHWGYYNGRASTNDSFLGAVSVSASNDETILPDSPRRPDAAYAKYGTLSRITYPTGGWTTFSYEGNDYSKKVTRLSSDGFRPVLAGGTGTCGGLRLAGYSSYGSDGTLLDSRAFEYKDGTASSGILLQMPRYRVDFSVSVLANTMSGKIWSNNMTRFGVSHIEYGTVTERRRDGSAVRYRFRTAAEIPDTLIMNNLSVEKMPGLGDWGGECLPFAGLFVNTSRQKGRGKLLSLENLRADGAPVSTESSVVRKLSAADEYIGLKDYLFISTADVGLWTGREDVSSRTESLVFGERRVTRTTSYAYNSDFLRTEERASDSRGTESLLRRSYVTEASSGVAKLMADAGMVGFPLSETRLVRPAGGQERVVSVTEYSYVQPAQVAHPSLFRVGRVMETDSTTGVRSVTSYTYDPLGRPLTRTAPDGTVTVYVWGYGGLYPVAAVSGTTLQAVRNVPELRSLQYGPIEGALSAESESGLRAISGAEVTVWEYEPLVGLTRETGPDGTSVSYTYNASGKLHEVLDALGRTSGAYLYSTDNKTDTSL